MEPAAERVSALKQSKKEKLSFPVYASALQIGLHLVRRQKGDGRPCRSGAALRQEWRQTRTQPGGSAAGYPLAGLASHRFQSPSRRRCVDGYIVWRVLPHTGSRRRLGAVVWKDMPFGGFRRHTTPP